MVEVAASTGQSGTTEARDIDRPRPPTGIAVYDGELGCRRGAWPLSEPARCSGREEAPGAKLVVSTSGGCSVVFQGRYIGYVHASLGDQWNAYARREGSTPDDHLGKCGQEEAVRRIVLAFHVARTEAAA